jgi:hypothetical protein
VNSSDGTSAAIDISNKTTSIVTCLNGCREFDVNVEVNAPKVMSLSWQFPYMPGVGTFQLSALRPEASFFDGNPEVYATGSGTILVTESSSFCDGTSCSTDFVADITFVPDNTDPFSVSGTMHLDIHDEVNTDPSCGETF